MDIIDAKTGRHFASVEEAKEYIKIQRDNQELSEIPGPKESPQEISSAPHSNSAHERIDVQCANCGKHFHSIESIEKHRCEGPVAIETGTSGGRGGEKKLGWMIPVALIVVLVLGVVFITRPRDDQPTDDPRTGATPTQHPDAGSIAFTTTVDGNSEIYVMNSKAGNPRRLTFNNSTDVYPTWSPDGSQIAYCSNRDGNYEIYVMNADGSNQTRLTSNTRDDLEPAWSPDGKKIVFFSPAMPNTKYEIFVMNADGSNLTKLTQTASNDSYPSWSMDGTRIIFASLSGPYYGIYLMDAGGGNRAGLISTSWNSVNPEWSPDATRMAFVSYPAGKAQIYVTNADGSNLIRLTNSVGNDSSPAWSPDGKRIAFQTDRNGSPEIYVMDADGSNQVKLADGATPAWSRRSYAAIGASKTMRSGQLVATTAPTGVPVGKPAGLTSAPPATSGSRGTVVVGGSAPMQSQVVAGWQLTLQSSKWEGGNLILKLTITNRGQRRTFGRFGTPALDIVAIDHTQKKVPASNPNQAQTAEEAVRQLEKALFAGKDIGSPPFEKEYYPDESWTDNVDFHMSPIFSGSCHLAVARTALR